MPCDRAGAGPNLEARQGFDGIEIIFVVFCRLLYPGCFILFRCRMANLLAAFDNLKQQYNIDYDLKPEQKQCLDHILTGKSLCCVLPTGFGKSAAYLLPPLLLDEVSDTPTYVCK